MRFNSISTHQASLLSLANVASKSSSDSRPPVFNSNSMRGHDCGRHDPCPICGVHGYSPYKYRYRHRGTTTPQVYICMLLFQLSQCMLSLCLCLLCHLLSLQRFIIRMMIGSSMPVQLIMLHRMPSSFNNQQLTMAMANSLSVMVQVWKSPTLVALRFPLVLILFGFQISYMFLHYKILTFCVTRFIQDNNCYFEFHPASFVVKDKTSRELETSSTISLLSDLPRPASLNVFPMVTNTNVLATLVPAFFVMFSPNTNRLLFLFLVWINANLVF